MLRNNDEWKLEVIGFLKNYCVKNEKFDTMYINGKSDAIMASLLLNLLTKL